MRRSRFANGRFDSNVENMKRRGALLPMYSLDMSSRLFFDRILSVKRVREMIFITKATAKHR